MKDPKGPVKAYKSPEELAKKHKVSLDKIIKQVKIGTKVEGEHTTSKSGAKITALQHVDELPDYYTRLKKVEKKNPMKESLETARMGLEGKRYCKLCRKSETQDECKFGPDIWQKFSIATVHPTNEETKGLYYNVNKRREKGLPPKKPGQKGYPTEKSWKESEKTAKEQFEFQEDHKEIASGKKKDEEGYMARVEFDQIDRAIAILRKKIKKGDQQIPAWVQSKITRAADFIDTAAEYMSSDETVTEDLKQAQQNVGASKCWKGKKVGNPPTKMKGGKEVPNCVPVGSSTTKEEVENDTQELFTFNQFCEIVENFQFNEESPDWQRKEGKNPEGGLIRKLIDKAKGRVEVGRTEGGGRIYQPTKIKKSTVKYPENPKTVTTKKSFDDDPWLQGAKVSGGSELKAHYRQLRGESKSFSGFMVEAKSAAWQRKEGKNPEGGLNKKGIASYRRENPGSKLSMAVTTPPSKLKPGSKAAKRRKSFCARMSGMEGPMKDEKGRPTRKALSLRKWNC